MIRRTPLIQSCLILAVLFSWAVGGAPAAQDSPSQEPSNQESSRQESAAQKSEDPSKGDSIRQWIEQLNSDLFLARERASRKLVEAGSAAIGPLADAADGEELEVASRAVRVLQEFSGHEDGSLALAALERLATLKNRPQERRDANAVLDLIREKRALADIARLGGIERDHFTVDGQTVVTHVHLDSSWKGGDQGLKLLRDIRMLKRLSIHGAPIRDEGLAHLAELKGLEQIELYATDVTKAGSMELAKALPGLERLDYRRGGLLGVLGSLAVTSDGARVDRVQNGSAADKAGLIARDVIQKFNGQPVKNFTELTDRIASRAGGEKVAIEVTRGDQVLTFEVTLDRWK